MPSRTAPDQEGNYLEAMGEVDAVAVDKTGTQTKGNKIANSGRFMQVQDELRKTPPAGPTQVRRPRAHGEVDDEVCERVERLSRACGAREGWLVYGR